MPRSPMSPQRSLLVCAAARNGFVVKRTRAGLGLVTSRAFARGQFVIEYTGELVADEEADRRGGRYLFEVNSRWTVDGCARENLSRYINHSCVPNCVARTRGKKVLIYALRRIRPGEELTYHYGKVYFDTYIRPHGCRCTRCAGKAAVLRGRRRSSE